MPLNPFAKSASEAGKRQPGRAPDRRPVAFRTRHRRRRPPARPTATFAAEPKAAEEPATGSYGDREHFPALRTCLRSRHARLRTRHPTEGTAARGHWKGQGLDRVEKRGPKRLGHVRPNFGQFGNRSFEFLHFTSTVNLGRPSRIYPLCGRNPGNTVFIIRDVHSHWCSQ